jgi:hypothetical protein
MTTATNINHQSTREKPFITNQMNIIADITAATAEQLIHSSGIQKFTPLTPVQTIIITVIEKSHVATYK